MPVAFFRLAAVDHKIVEEVIVPRTFPYLRMHDDSRIESHHFERQRRAGRRGEIIMSGHHVAPPCFLNVAFELDAQRSIVPEAVQAAVDLARLKDKSAPFAK